MDPLVSVPYALMAEELPDKSIDGTKLQRESVWPEHEGRGNTIVAYYGTVDSGNVLTLATVPTGKTFILTDIYFAPGSGVNLAGLQIAKKLGGGDQLPLFQGRTTLWSHGTGSTGGIPYQVSFKAGIPIEEGWDIRVQQIVFSSPTWFTISGYEISN